VGVGDGFLQFGPWRLGQVDGTHASLSHESGKTAMIWRSDGTEHPGPRTDYNTFGKALTPADIFVGDGLVQMGEWRIGNVDGAHMSIFSEKTKKTAVIYRSDGTIHPGPREDWHLIITNMSAALTSSTFVGAKVSVAKTTTASKRVAFSVQANASGPKKVRIPISFFFVRLKNHHRRSFQAGGGASKFCISSN
jgi:hypothetical protein